jgi:hypothetical protein
MKFEYELNYDFVSEKLSFKILKMPEKLRKNTDNKIITDRGTTIEIKSLFHPEIGYNANIFLRGVDCSRDNDTSVVIKKPLEALDIADALAKFQKWVEENTEAEIVMTIKEIEQKLGIKNLKIKGDE